MEDINHSERAHARLSASGSSRWLTCFGSVKAEQDYPDSTSTYAEEGTAAHELADYCLSGNLESAKDYLGKTINDIEVDREMVNAVNTYLEHVRMHLVNPTCELLTESRVSFSNVVPDGFGTLDSAVINSEDGTIDIFDLKYGRGVQVEAEENTQAMLYLIGLFNTFKDKYDFKTFTKFRVHIIQPRIYNISVWEVSKTRLKQFIVEIKNALLEINKANPVRVAGEKQCQFCKAKGDCKELLKLTEDTIMAEFENLDKPLVLNLTDEDRIRILDNKDLIVSFLNEVEEVALRNALAGKHLEGYTLIEGTSRRKWADNAEEVLASMLGVDAYTSKLITITEAKEMVGDDILKDIIVKPEGKPKLVKDKESKNKKPYDNGFEKLD